MEGSPARELVMGPSFPVHRDLTPGKKRSLLKILVVVLVLDKEPSEYDDESEDEYNP
jgi:hypothetical protein